MYGLCICSLLILLGVIGVLVVLMMCILLLFEIGWFCVCVICLGVLLSCV